MNKNTYIFFIISLFTLTSCKIKEKASDLNYLQNAEQIATETAIKNQQYTIQPGDQINVYVSAKNMEVVKPFNQLYYSSQSPSVNNNTPATEKAYIVDSKGNIDFPILGEITTSNKTIEELKEELSNGLFPIVYLKEKITNHAVVKEEATNHAVVVVEIKRNKVFVLDPYRGERTLEIEQFQDYWHNLRGLTIIIE